jgi:hypothetical protein
MKKSNNQPENHHFFKALEITGTSPSLILICLQRTGISSFLILEYLENQNRQFFKNSKNNPTLV